MKIIKTITGLFLTAVLGAGMLGGCAAQASDSEDDVSPPSLEPQGLCPGNYCACFKACKATCGPAPNCNTICTNQCDV
jgi:hypothetical protein